MRGDSLPPPPTRLALVYVSLAALLMPLGAGAQVTFTIDSVARDRDANPGDGICASAKGECTAEAAVMEAAALLRRGSARSLQSGHPPLRPRIVNPVPADAFVAACSRPVAGSVFTVNSTTDADDANPGDGLCATSAGECTLRAAVTEANALPGQDEVDLPSGTFPLALGQLSISDDLMLRGAGMTRTTIDGGGGDRVLSLGEGGAVHVDIAGVHITHGTTSSSGGGILAGGAVVSISDSSITDNQAGVDGGGVACDQVCALVISGSRITRNRAVGYGGGIEEIISSALTISNSTIASNHAMLGGGIYYCESPTNISGSTISDNIADTDGGGLFPIGPTTVINSTISGNIAGGRGGGLFAYEDDGSGSGEPCVYGGASLQLTNATVVRNSATEGGGVAAHSGGCTKIGCNFSAYHAYLANSLIAANSATASADCASLADGDPAFVTVNDALISAGHNLIGDGSGCLPAGADPTDQIGTAAAPIDPLLGPLGDNFGPTLTIGLLPGSPALNAVPVADCVYDDDGDSTTPEVPLRADQRGVPRPLGGACDIGAFEGLAPKCDDGIDNDGDGKIDFPADQKCLASWYNSESERCGLGAELALVLPLLMRRRARRNREPLASHEAATGSREWR